MNRATALLLILLAAAACKENVPPAAARPAPVDPPTEENTPLDLSEQGNLLDIDMGASVIFRTAELTLEQSALMAIDGDPAHGWISPPGDTDQTMVFALAAPARIEALGVRTRAPENLRITRLRVEASSDNINYALLAEPELAAVAETQTFPVQPVTAQYLRVRITGAGGAAPTLISLQARGSFVEPPRAHPIAGCWTINGLGARFEENDGTVRGRIETDPPTAFEGTADGALYRFAWARAGDRGAAAITVGPASQHLSGLRWFREPHRARLGGTWFGEKAPCAPAGKAAQDVLSTFLKLDGRAPIYTLAFDEKDQLIAAKSERGLATIVAIASRAAEPVELVAREFRDPEAPVNRRRAQTRLDSLRAALEGRGVDLSRIRFTAAGSENASAMIRTRVVQHMQSVIEIVVK